MASYSQLARPASYKVQIDMLQIDQLSEVLVPIEPRAFFIARSPVRMECIYF